MPAFTSEGAAVALIGDNRYNLRNLFVQVLTTLSLKKIILGRFYRDGKINWVPKLSENKYFLLQIVSCHHTL